MNIGTAQAIVTKGIVTILMSAGPIVGAGLLVGFSISLFQAVTQIQEQTLTFVPKMVTVLIVIAVTFPWMGSLVLGLTKELWAGLPALAR